jgi:aspartyl-tRNA(Asn)/glutamyl-tRNA(Gln) amidotransferase subunit A
MSSGRPIAHPSDLQVVVPQGELINDCHPKVAAGFAEATAYLASAGIQVTVRNISAVSKAQELMDTCGTIVGREAARNHGHTSKDQHGHLQAPTARRLARDYSTGPGLRRLYDALPALRRRYVAELDGALLLCPTVRLPPPEVAVLNADASLFDAVNARALRTTMVLSYLGACGVSCPAPSLAGLSGLLLSAPQGDDERLLRAAQIVANATRQAKALETRR